MLKGLFGKVLKCRNKMNKKKKKIKDVKIRRGVLSFTLFFLPIANEDKNRMGDNPPPFFKKSS